MFSRRFTGHTAKRAAKRCPVCRGFLPGQAGFTLLPQSLCTCERCEHNVAALVRKPSVCHECKENQDDHNN